MKSTDSFETRKTIRTTLYDDQEFSLWEMEILHTPIVQRLYDLKQLGFADKVFPDAVHSRFNHVLGVVQVADRLVDSLVGWLQREPYCSHSFAYWDNVQRSISGLELSQLTADRKAGVRLIALLHDLTHAAYGHTLEDEVQIFTQKHDHPRRQAVFFDALLAELLNIWLGEESGHPQAANLGIGAYAGIEQDGTAILDVAKALKGHSPDFAKKVAGQLAHLEFACTALLHLEWAHGSEYDAALNPPDLLIGEVRRCLDSSSKGLSFTKHRDVFLIDVVGNTICADLLDYARRDATNAGLKLGFDVRLIKYAALVSVVAPLAPKPRGQDVEPCIRLATQFFTNKMRHDVLSEMSAILKARYLITERILFHPAKCALGAVLGKAVALSGLENPPTWIQMLGDQAFLGMLDRLCVYSDAVLSELVSDSNESIDSVVEKLIPIEAEKQFRELVANSTKNITGTGGPIDIRAAQEKLTGARRLLGRVASRRRPLLVYRLRSDVQVGDRVTAKEFATQFGDLAGRSKFEREVEIACRLPVGAFVIHCLPDRPGMKIAKALVVGNDLDRARHLRDVAGKNGDPYFHELLPFQSEVMAIEEMYQSIWQFHAFLDVDHERKASLVRSVLFELLKAPNDGLLEAELPEASNRYDFVAGEFWGRFGFDQLRPVIEILDELPRHRYGNSEQAERDLAVRAIESLFKAKGQLKLLDDKE